MSREMRYFSLALTFMLPVAAFAQSVPGTDRQFDVYVIHDVMVPMRDGVKLATDVYLPAVQGQPLPGPWPTVVERTPYGKGAFLANTPTGADYAKRGYALVVQDVRGRYNSEGVFLSYSQEGPDGLDTMQWIHDQPWCNRRIGVTGSSYFASTAQAILVQNAPGLAAGIIRVRPGNYHEDGAWNGGTFLLAHNVNYALSLALVGKEAAADAAVGSAIAAASRPPAAFHLMIQSPLAPGAAPFGLAPSYDAWYQDWQDHELFDSYWQTIGNSFTDHYSRSPDVPILLVSEWYDAFLGGALDGYQGYTRSHHSPVHMIIGGGEHLNICGAK